MLSDFVLPIISNFAEIRHFVFLISFEQAEIASLSNQQLTLNVSSVDSILIDFGGMGLLILLYCCCFGRLSEQILKQFIIMLKNA